MQGDRNSKVGCDRQRRHNRERLDHIIRHRAEPRGWPADLARAYLEERLVFEYTPARQAGMELFFTKAREHGLLGPLRQLRVLEV